MSKPKDRKSCKKNVSTPLSFAGDISATNTYNIIEKIVVSVYYNGLD